MHTFPVELKRFYPVLQSITSQEFLGNAGGFSGAKLWKLQVGDDSLCLRRWPKEHPTVDRLSWIHDVLQHVCSIESQESFISCLPVIIRNSAGDPFTSFAGYLWELTSWMAGCADYQIAPSKSKLESAMKTLAKFHLATQSYPQTVGKVGSSVAWNKRLEKLEHFQTRGIRQIKAALHNIPPSRRIPNISEVVELFLAGSAITTSWLKSFRNQELPLQPCLRDIWHDHVLFQEQQVSAFIDFGAMSVDHASVDIARLAGSLCQDNQADWKIAIAAYRSLRPLSDREIELARLFDCTAILMTGLTWIEWLYVEKRRFDEPELISPRIQQNYQRLLNLVQHGPVLK